MNPCELNAAIAAISNFLFVNLSKKDFLFLNVFLSELSKSMFAMEILRGICRIESKDDREHEKGKEKSGEKHKDKENPARIEKSAK